MESAKWMFTRVRVSVSCVCPTNKMALSKKGDKQTNSEKEQYVKREAERERERERQAKKGTTDPNGK